jgi:hypothetical protein
VSNAGSNTRTAFVRVRDEGATDVRIGLRAGARVDDVMADRRRRADRHEPRFARTWEEALDTRRCRIVAAPGEYESGRSEHQPVAIRDVYPKLSHG